MNKKEIEEYLFAKQDIAYRDFNAPLMPTVAKEKMIGVRIPEIRKLAKKMKGEAGEFLSDLPHAYYEEDLLHAILISYEKDAEEVIGLLDAFLPYVYSWSITDSIRPDIFQKYHLKLYRKIPEWTSSDHEYTRRFGIGMYMAYFLDDYFDPLILERVNEVKGGEYYVDMMKAWFFATALAKQYDDTIPYIEGRRLPETVHRMTMRKALESYRVSDEHKAYLRSLSKK